MIMGYTQVLYQEVNDEPCFSRFYICCTRHIVEFIERLKVRSG